MLAFTDGAAKRVDLQHAPPSVCKLGHSNNQIRTLASELGQHQMTDTPFKVGDRVKKRSGYEYPGFIVSVFTNRAGAVNGLSVILSPVGQPAPAENIQTEASPFRGIEAEVMPSEKMS
jgi:hypothetical protein